MQVQSLVWEDPLEKEMATHSSILACETPWTKEPGELPGVKKEFHDPDNHDGVITHLEPDILECEVKWALESITMNKASGGDGIPVELFQILKDDAVKLQHSICQQIWKIQQWPKKGHFSSPLAFGLSSTSFVHSDAF